MDRLILDTLFPPPPSQLIADLDAAGAHGAAVYVWRPGGVGTWTPGHVAALRAVGKLVFPIIVPQSDGGDINGMLGAAQSFGFQGGPITVDIELPNLPPASWEEAFDRSAAANGFSDFDYGTPHDLGFYQPDNQNWVAEWLRTGQLQPLPALPVGRSGWQFVNDIIVNGHAYDASVIVGSVFGLEDDMTPDQAAQLQRVFDILDTIPATRAGGNAGDLIANVYQQLRSLDGKAVPGGDDTVLSHPPVTLTADFATMVVASLIANSAFLDALATAVAHKLGAALDKA